MHKTIELSVVIPVYNEAAGLRQFHQSLTNVVESSLGGAYEILYCDDGSTDETTDIIRALHYENPHVQLLRLSRNFGKENALSAGIEAAQGQAVIMLDSDGQHPVELLPKFIQLWRDGAQVVIGIRDANAGEGWLKRFGSRLFYASFNKVARPKIIPGSTDYRLIDRDVREAFLQLHESNRITRGLIDWLGFKREFVTFAAHPRTHGKATYSSRALVRLAANSFVSLSSRPLYLFGYLGAFITVAALLLGITVGIEQFIMRDPLQWKFTGTALLGVIILFLVGIILLSQGILSIYVAHIHSLSKGRPLYIVDKKSSTIPVKKPTTGHIL